MNTLISTITQDRLDAIAADLDRAARELAHSTTDTAEDFGVAYVRAVAETCGAIAADQCAAGEAWAPEAILDGDRDAITEAADPAAATRTLLELLR